MRIRTFSMTAALAAFVLPAVAQTVDPACTDPTFVGSTLQGGKACQRAVDTFGYTSEQYAILLSAGNMEIGRADAEGGFLKFHASLRLTGMNLSTPAYPASTIPPGPVGSPDAISTQVDYFGLVAGEGDVGLFRGLDLGGFRVGALDAYVSLNLVPGKTAAGYQTVKGNAFYFGWGARVGVLQEGTVIPAVGVSYWQRDLPDFSVHASDLFNNFVSISSLSVKTHAWSATAGKHFGGISLVLGAGQTDFSTSGMLAWYVNGQQPTTFPTISASSTQTQVFGDFGFKLGPVDVALEAGQVSGSAVQTYNTFDPAAGSSRWFGSVALGFGH